MTLEEKLNYEFADEKCFNNLGVRIFHSNNPDIIINQEHEKQLTFRGNFRF